MSESEHPNHEISHAEIDWDSDGQPLSRAFGDIYFSRANGLEETRHVFLHHNRLAERWAKLAETEARMNSLLGFVIGETGFGSGLNFLAAWQLWSQTAPKDAHLHFVSVEKYPLNKTDLTRALALWPELAAFSQALIDQYPAIVGSGFHRLKFNQGRVNLTLIIDDAAAGFSQMLGSAHPLFAGQCAKVDAWFLDGFAPAKNPQMWSDQLFDALGLLSHGDTTATTFSAAGIVKQGLRRAGFSVKKVAGFGRKREMVSALFTADKPLQNPEDFIHHQCYSPYPTPWAVVRSKVTESGENCYGEHLRGKACNEKDRHQQIFTSASREEHRGSKIPATKRRVIIIGGGLAGCHTARAMAERNWQVTLVERQPQLASEASGNPQGVLYAKLSPKQEPQAVFNLASLQFALRHYRQFWNKKQGDGLLIAQDCGVLQLAHKEAEARLHNLLRPGFAAAGDLVRFVDAQQASDIAGITLHHQGIYFPTAGWISPRLLCEELVNHPAIDIQCNTEVLSLRREGEQWQIIDCENNLFLSAPVVVIATANDAKQFEQSAHLPIKAIRGQITYLPATPASEKLKTVVCGEGYIGPALTAQNQKVHFTGATFNLLDESPQLRAADHQTNLDNLQQHTPELAECFGATDATQLDGRVAFRCTTPDYLPLVGPLPNVAEFVRDFAPLRKNARLGIPCAGSYLEGLYINIGHGSRGLAYTPLCAELLAAQINHEVLPVSRELANTLNPARFIIRDLVRNKI